MCDARQRGRDRARGRRRRRSSRPAGLIAGRREELLAAAVEEIGPAASYLAGDVRAPGAAAGMVGTVLDRHSRLDVLVNNAGGQYFVPAEAIEPKGWSAVTRLNVGGTELMSRAA